MHVVIYNDLAGKSISGLSKFTQAMEKEDFTQAEFKKVGNNLYRAKLVVPLGLFAHFINTRALAIA